MKIQAALAGAAPTRFVSLRDLTVRQGKVIRLDDISLTVRPGEVMCLLGRAGAGKSLLLATFAGRIKPLTGTMLVDGRTLKRPSGLKRLASLSGGVRPPGRNAGAAVRKLAHLRRREAVATVPVVLEQLGLGEQAGSRPRTLSPGGQAALCLAGILLRRMRLLLIDDETLAGLDEPMRLALPQLLRDAASDGRAVIFATRDARLALSLADRVVLLEQGRIVQDGTPQTLYERPYDARAARLLGPANLMAGLVREARQGGFIWSGGGERFVQYLQDEEARPRLGTTVTLCLRPERMILLEPGADADNRLAGTVTEAGGAGSALRLRVATGLGEVTVLTPAWRAGGLPQVGEAVTLAWASDAASMLSEDPREPVLS